MERAPRQPKVGGVSLDHDDAATEALSKDVGPTRVQLDGDDPRARIEERGSERARARTDIEHQITAADSAVGDEPFSPARLELMPSPPPWLCHGNAPLS